jgi:hypothetical protein
MTTIGPPATENMKWRRYFRRIGLKPQAEPVKPAESRLCVLIIVWADVRTETAASRLQPGLACSRGIHSPAAPAGNKSPAYKLNRPEGR